MEIECWVAVADSCTPYVSRSLHWVLRMSIYLLPVACALLPVKGSIFQPFFQISTLGRALARRSTTEKSSRDILSGVLMQCLNLPSLLLSFDLNTMCLCKLFPISYCFLFFVISTLVFISLINCRYAYMLNATMAIIYVIIGTFDGLLVFVGIFAPSYMAIHCSNVIKDYRSTSFSSSAYSVFLSFAGRRVEQAISRLLPSGRGP